MKFKGEKMLTKKIIIPAAVAVIIGGAVLGVSASKAQAQFGNNRFAGLVQMIAQKFNLDQGAVQTVFDQYGQQQKANMQQKLDDRLNQAVQAGKLTQAQKDALVAKLAELKNKYSTTDFKNMTPDQRKQARQNEQAELISWAQSQGIDQSYLKMFGFGMRGVGFRGPKPSASPQS